MDELLGNQVYNNTTKFPNGPFQIPPIVTSDGYTTANFLSGVVFAHGFIIDLYNHEVRSAHTYMHNHRYSDYRVVSII